MVGTHRWPLFTSLDLGAYRDWLAMRRRLSTDGYFWTWVQTHLPGWFVRHALEHDGKGELNTPAGPHPEQVRLLTYCALAAGYRGVAYWADGSLADSQQGRDRLLALALLNQELKMLEPILTRVTQPPDWVPTSRKEVMAAVFRTPKCVLVLPIWIGGGSQFVPGQSATPGLKIKVVVPYTMTAWEVSPGRVRGCPIRRELGGTEVELKSFSLTAAVVFTSDLGPSGLVVQLQDQQRSMGRLAAQWLHDQAKEQLAKVEKVEAELGRMGRAVPDSEALLKRAREALERCVRHRSGGEHSEAYGQAEVALRALRVVRVFRLISAVPQMRRVVEALFGAMPGILATLAILSIVFYIGAVMGTTLFHEEEGFRDLGEGMLTLFALSQFDGWGEIVWQLQPRYPYAWLFVLSFTVIAAFAVLNLFIGVIVEAVQQAPQEAIQEELDDLEEDVEDIAEAQEDAAVVQARILEEIRALREEVAALRGANPGTPPSQAG